MNNLLSLAGRHHTMWVFVKYILPFALARLFDLDVALDELELRMNDSYEGKANMWDAEQ